VTDENLVVFPSPVVEPLYRRSQLISDHARTKDLISALWRGSVVPRAVAESELSMTQAVAYATLRCGSDLVCLRRRSALRAELDGRWTIVFGGHVNSNERDGLQGSSAGGASASSESLRTQAPRWAVSISASCSRLRSRLRAFI
jgi:hypothetical protein